MANKPTPPAGYSLQDVPDFLRSTAEQAKIVSEPPNHSSIAQVNTANPSEIDVHEPSMMDQGILNHEVTHVFQLSRNPEIVQRGLTVAAPAPGGPVQQYGYGGTDGLIAAQRQHKTITDFNLEQQADMVRNYQQGTQDAIRRGDGAALDKLNQAYGPYLRQLANLPGKNDSMTTMTPRDLAPLPPPSPPAAISGMLAPNPMLGGRARYVAPKGLAPRREQHPTDAWQGVEQ